MPHGRRFVSAVFRRIHRLTLRPTLLARWVVLLMVLPGMMFGDWILLPKMAWATVTNDPDPEPEIGDCAEPGSCECEMPTALEGAPSKATTAEPIIYFTGSVTESAVDLRLPGPKFGWSQSRTYNSRVANADVTNLGRRWLSGNGDVRLAVNADDSNDIDLITSASSKRIFNWTGNAYATPTGTALTLVAYGTKFEVTNTQTGDLWIFHNFVQGNKSGELDERTTLAWKAAGLTGQVYSYNGSGHLETITTAQGQDEQIVFEHAGSGASMRLMSVKVGPTSNEYMEVVYTYKGDNGGYHAHLGANDDLVQVRVGIKDSAGTWVYRYTQYRYNSADATLKSVFEPDVIQWIIDNDGTMSTPEDILTRGDTWSVGSTGKDIKDVASRSFTYYTGAEDTGSINTPWGSSQNLHSRYGGTQLNETGRVKTETVNGGCASCGGGGGGSGITRSFYYMAKNGGTTEADPDKVAIIVVEDSEDSASTAFQRKVLGLNKEGTALREGTIEDPEASPVKAWCTSITLDNDLRISQRRQPSAHTIVNSNALLAQFLDPTTSTNDAATLNDSDGVIYSYAYVHLGMRAFDTLVQKGEGGTAYYVSAIDYGDGDGDTQGRDQDDGYLVTATYSYPTATTTRTAGDKTEYEYTFYDDAAGPDTMIEQRITTLPVVSTAQNGPNVATVLYEYFDEAGRVRWTKDGEGYAHYRSYHPENGNVAYQVTDVNTGSLSSEITSGSGGKWLAWGGGAVLTRAGGLPNALQLVAKIEYDAEARPTLWIDAGGKQHYTVYGVNQMIHFPYWDGSDSLGPIQVRKTNDAGIPQLAYTVAGIYANVSISSSKPVGFNSEPGPSDYLSLTRYFYQDIRRRLDHVDNYHLIPASGDTLSTHFNRTVFKYDTRGRLAYTVQVVSGMATGTSTEQVTQTVYDVLNRTIQVNRGVSNASHDMTSSYSTYPTLATVSEFTYDGGSVGDGQVTKSKRFFGTGGSDYTAAAYHRTYRGHLRGVELQDSSANPEVPVTLYDVDWQGRTTAVAQLVTNPTWNSILSGDGYDVHANAGSQSSRRTLSVATYDKLGRVYQSDQYSISTSDGSKGNKRRTDSYYNRNDKCVASVTYGQAANETVYDGAGRRYQSRTVKALEGGNSGGSGFYSSGKFLYRDPQPAPSFSSASPVAMSGGDGEVIEMTHNYLDVAGNSLETHTFEINHNDTNGLYVSEGGGGGSRDYVRRSVYFWYDEANHVTTTANYGAGDTSAGAGSWKWAAMPARGSAPAASDEDQLVATYTYDSSGRRETIVGKQNTSTTVTTKVLYDALGRKRYQVANYVNFTWTPSTDSVSNTGSGDQDNATGWQYNGLGSVVKLIALDQDANGTTSDNEVTEYKYEDAYNASLQTKAIYPDSSSGSDVVTMTYALDGQMTQRTDQRGTVIDFTYNDRRQPEKQTASTLGGATDGSTRAIKHEYDTLARVERITSYSNTGATTATNQILYEYDNLGRVAKSWQAHLGEVDTMETKFVEYVYDDTSSSGLLTAAGRPSQLKYPSYADTTCMVEYQYGSGGSFDQALSRIAGLKHDGEFHALRELTSYNYCGTNRLMEVRFKSATVNPEVLLDRGFSSGDYANLDRFGRVKKQLWKTSSTPLDQFDYTHDLAGNRTSRDLSSGSLDQVYEYDALDRLVDYKEGSVSMGAIGSPTKEADWTLDGLGNWSAYEEKTSGTTTLNQTRDHNVVNEIGTIGASTGSNWIDVVHDAAGNMTEAPKAGAETTKHKYVWDAWNRLVKVTDSAGTTTIASFTYDGLNRRVTKTTAFFAEYFLSEQNQVLEEYNTANGSLPTHQYVWHPYYVDALAARHYDVGTSATDYYTLHDANFNVTAAINSSAAVQERHHYTPYGRTTFLNSSYASPTATSNIGQEILYTGRQLDPETQLYYYRARYYHPTLGRFVGRDPIGYEAGDGNLYRYVGGNPTGFTDPSGYDREDEVNEIIKVLSALCDSGKLKCTKEECLAEVKAIADAYAKMFYDNKRLKVHGVNTDYVKGWMCYQWQAHTYNALEPLLKSSKCFEMGRVGRIKYFPATTGQIIVAPSFPRKIEPTTVTYPAYRELQHNWVAITCDVDSSRCPAGADTVYLDPWRGSGPIAFPSDADPKKQHNCWMAFPDGPDKSKPTGATYYVTDPSLPGSQLFECDSWKW